MDEHLKKYRDRLRIIIILYVFSEPISNDAKLASVFRTEIRIQAIDFLLRYPDFFSLELLELYQSDNLDTQQIEKIVREIFSSNEPVLRVEEMEKFFHGAYESIDDVIAFLSSISFIKYESKRRTDGKEYDKLYYLTTYGKEKIESQLTSIPSVQWYLKRCELIKFFFGKFSGTDLKKRQYRYVEEYAEIPYKSKIKQVQAKVITSFVSNFNKPLL